MLLPDRRYFRSFDWASFYITFLLAIIGLIFIFSATYKPEQPCSIFFKKQAAGLVFGFFIYWLFCLIDHRHLLRWGYFAYFGVIALLLFTMLKGVVGMGAQRWVDLFFFRLQTSELTKLLFPAFATYYFFTQSDNPTFKFKDYVPVLGILAVSFVLILKQPDLGTALILLFSGLVMLWLAGLANKYFIIGALIATMCAPLAWCLLKPYQRQRILVFMGEGDARKERYQIEQSKIAVGSGGLTGRGYLRGTQNKFLFLPESRTDFIFSVVSEEVGFIGAMLVLLLYAILFLRMFAIIRTVQAPFVQLLAMGLAIPIAIAAIVNIGMVLGLLPIVGIPLPLMSYGLSNLWITLASLGWINGITWQLFYQKS